MRSMTGFGRGTAEHGGARATVDIRAVNHRFVDLKLRGAVTPALEEAISARVRAAIERGSVNITVHVVRAAAVGFRIDPEAAKSAHASLAALAKTLGLAGPDLALVLAQPGVVVSGEDEAGEDGKADRGGGSSGGGGDGGSGGSGGGGGDSSGGGGDSSGGRGGGGGDSVSGGSGGGGGGSAGGGGGGSGSGGVGVDGHAVMAAVDVALAQLVGMRDREGLALARELTTRVDELDALRATIAKLAADLPERTQRRLQERLKRLLADEVSDKSSDAAGWLDPARLAQEVALLAERADVTEELVRLASHLEQARALIAGPGASGRRLDFLVQEIGRELNTIGSKSALAEISTAIVEAKAVLEKVREQVQNVE